MDVYRTLLKLGCSIQREDARRGSSRRAPARQCLLLPRRRAALQRHTLDTSPNTTSYLQPQDTGIIRQFKAQLSKHQTRHVLDCLGKLLERAKAEGSECQRRDADILTAVRWAQEAWKSVTDMTIKICWRHTQILDDDMCSALASSMCAAGELPG